MRPSFLHTSKYCAIPKLLYFAHSYTAKVNECC